MEYSAAGTLERWISQRREEEVMTQEGVVAQLAVKPGGRRSEFHVFLPTESQYICFPLAAVGVNRSINKVFVIV